MEDKRFFWQHNTRAAERVDGRGLIKEGKMDDVRKEKREREEE